MVFKIALVSFLCLRKIVYSGMEYKKALLSKIKVTKSNISFIKSNQYVILQLK